MPVHDVDEETQLSSSTFSTLTGRKRPLVLRGAAGDWGASSFFTVIPRTYSRKFEFGPLEFTIPPYHLIVCLGLVV